MFFIQPTLLPAQTLRAPLAAGYLKLGAYSLQHTDVFSAIHNPASLAGIKSITGGIYSEKRYLLKELSQYNFILGLPTASGNFGIGAGYFGFSDFNETKIGMMYGRSIGEKISLGAEFFYQGIHAAGYGNANAIGIQSGVLFHFNEKLHAGLRIANPVGGKFGKYNQEKLSSVYALGFGFDASKQLFAAVELEKEEDQPLNVNAGIQYSPAPLMHIRLGLATATPSAWLGTGINWKNFRLDLVSGYHPYMGFSPGVMLLFQLQSRPK